MIKDVLWPCTAKGFAFSIRLKRDRSKRSLLKMILVEDESQPYKRQAQARIMGIIAHLKYIFNEKSYKNQHFKTYNVSRKQHKADIAGKRRQYADAFEVVWRVFLAFGDFLQGAKNLFIYIMPQFMRRIYKTGGIVERLLRWRCFTVLSIFVIFSFAIFGSFTV